MPEGARGSAGTASADAGGGDAAYAYVSEVADVEAPQEVRVHLRLCNFLGRPLAVSTSGELRTTLVFIAAHMI